MAKRKRARVTAAGPGRQQASVGAFLEHNRLDKRWRGGQPCRTCSHVESKKINEEIRYFAKAKEDGHQMPWSRFFRDYITPVYGLNIVNTALMRHVHECLGLR
jgi:hypothetical protein